VSPLPRQCSKQSCCLPLQPWVCAMLDVSVDANDGFPELEHVCEKYKRRLERLEKAAEDLELFRAQVRAWYASLRLKRSELKRSKDTSSIDASPDTVRVRPPSKKLLTARHLDFVKCTQKIT